MNRLMTVQTNTFQVVYVFIENSFVSQMMDMGSWSLGAILADVIAELQALFALGFPFRRSKVDVVFLAPFSLLAKPFILPLILET